MTLISNFSLKSSLSPIHDKINFRREKVLKFRLSGFTNIVISRKLRYSLSTIEKDIKILRIVLASNLEEDVTVE